MSMLSRNGRRKERRELPRWVGGYGWVGWLVGKVFSFKGR